jgi:hypothetical protein
MTRKHPSQNAPTLLCLLAMLVASSSAGADPTRQLMGPDELSGNETVIHFDDQGFIEGDEIPALSGVDFEMTDGSPALYTEDPFPREFGPVGSGATSNFAGSAFPYPDLSLVFDAPVHTLAFGMRANPIDDVQVTFWSGGTLVDQLTLPTRGSDQLYFYGFQNDVGFDEVLIDVLGNPFLRTGAASFDNLTFDSAGGAAPVALSCVGFESPLDQAIARSPKSEFLTLLSQSRPHKSLKARLMDADGFEMARADLLEPPVVLVSHLPARGEEEMDVTAQVVRGGDDRFVAHEDGSWSIELDKRGMRAPGVYRMSMHSGDELEYTVEPTCEMHSVRRRR